MTIYEQIQRALDYLEDHLVEQVHQNTVASQAGMSVRGFQSYFWMVTGFSFKQYLVQRRLSQAKAALLGSRQSVLQIALDCGYGSHEAFTRAFKNEFGLSPLRFRERGQDEKSTEKIVLFKEMYMGVIIKDLPEMEVVCFAEFQPEPEEKAKKKMLEWLKTNPEIRKPYRIFGHNIDAQGNLQTGSDYAGYKFLLQIPRGSSVAGGDIQKIQSGKFVVTGIEGPHREAGTFIPQGWAKLDTMIKQKGYQVKKPVRWFEEELEPSTPGNLRLDLYLEIEEGK